MSKNTIRENIKALRSQLTTWQQRELSQACCQHMIESPEFQTSEVIAVYRAVNGETDPSLLEQAIFNEEKRCLLPVIYHERLRFAEVTPQMKLIPNSYGILEPEHRLLVDIDEIDLICMPLVAFDNKGNRLGMGKGYYDRCLQTVPDEPPFKIGLAYTMQEVENIPVDEWDQAMTAVCCESGLIRF